MAAMDRSTSTAHINEHIERSKAGENALGDHYQEQILQREREVRMRLEEAADVAFNKKQLVIAITPHVEKLLAAAITEPAANASLVTQLRWVLVTIANVLSLKDGEWLHLETDYADQQFQDVCRYYPRWQDDALCLEAMMEAKRFRHHESTRLMDVMHERERYQALHRATYTVLEGWLTKEGAWMKSWKQRWFVLTTEQLLYYQTDTGLEKVKPKGVINLNDTFVAELPKAASADETLFYIDVKGKRRYPIKASCQDERDEWIEAINNLRRRLPGFGVCLDDFNQIKVVGQGGFGKVVLVQAKDSMELFAMKIMSKKRIQQNDQVKAVMLEREIAEKTQHVFLVGLSFAFHTMTSVYIGMEFVQGGELFSLLRRQVVLKESDAKLYIAEIALGINHLHEQGIIYRDLKPENVLICSNGHLKITDFGIAKMGVGENSGAQSFCGTPEYFAPEVLQMKRRDAPVTSYDLAVDYWSLGILLFEMLVGSLPFQHHQRLKLYQMIVYKPWKIPSHRRVSPAAETLLHMLLNKEPTERLTTMSLLSSHEFFEPLDFTKVLALYYQPTFKPTVRDPLDTRNFDDEFTRLHVTQDVAGRAYDPNDSSADSFSGFSFEAPAESQAHPNASMTNSHSSPSFASRSGSAAVE
jgi:serine/threonine protein kinase